MKSHVLHTEKYQQLIQAFELRKLDEGKSESHIKSVVNLSREFLHYLEEQSICDLSEVNQVIINDYFKYLKSRKNQRRLGTLSNTYLD